MVVRHLVAKGNVDASGRVMDPQMVRHGALRAGRVCALAGSVDPATHLNLDFDAHRLEACVVVEVLEVEAPVIATGGAYRLAVVPREAFRHLGYVDVGARRLAWLAAFRTSPRPSPTALAPRHGEGRPLGRGEVTQ